MDTKKQHHHEKNPLQQPNPKTNPSQPRQEPSQPNKSNPSQKKPGSNW